MGRQVDGRARGQALVEFALVLPVFLLLIFGIIDVGRYVYVANAFNEGAREGARYGSVAQWQYSCPASVPLANQNRYSCTAAVVLGRMAAAPAYVQAPAVACPKRPLDPASAVPPAACRAGYVLTSGPDSDFPRQPAVPLLYTGHRSDPWESDDLRASSRGDPMNALESSPSRRCLK